MRAKPIWFLSALFAGVLLISFLNWTFDARVVGAVQQRITPTPAPTLTTAERDEFEVSVLTKLRSAFGFDHPLFQELAERYSQASPEYIRDLQDGLLDVSIATTWFANHRYVVGSMPSPILGSTAVLLFRVDAQGHVTELKSGFGLPTGYSYLWLDDSEGFADRNQNQRPELPIYGYTGGNCCPRYMLLLELNPQGEFVNITPRHTDVTPTRFNDLDQDGVWEIEGVLPVSIPLDSSSSNRPSLVRWFAWDGSRYVETSANYQDWYQQRDIDPLWEYLGYRQPCVPLPLLLYTGDISVYQVLLDYYAMGRLDEGWAEIQRRANWAECKPRLMPQYEREISLFEDWLSALRDGTLITDYY